MDKSIREQILRLEKERDHSIAVVNWAKVFTLLGIDWAYSRAIEPASEFYLPEQKIFFSVSDETTVCSSIEVIGTTDGRFRMAGDSNFDETWLTLCKGCGKRFFLDSTGSFVCPICGEYDGDHHLDKTYYGHENIFNSVLVDVN